MYGAHLSRIVSQIRVYEDSDGYEDRKPYTGIFTIQHISDTTVYISGAHGENLTREAYEECVKLLQEIGVKTILYERRGKVKTMKVNDILRG
tara:strand:+ start:1145 stop:1420 length:276 start_codon:yes stop_codon:yes gene_type:complete